MENEQAHSVIVYEDEVPRATSALAVTRVMSPNITNQKSMLGAEWICPLCRSASGGDPAVCANCGKYGHEECVGIEIFQGYPLCGICFAQVVIQYAAIGDAQRRVQWNTTLSKQFANWKSRAIEAMGISASVGVTMGSVAATAAGVAYAGLQGFVQGASRASSAQVPIQDEPLAPAIAPAPEIAHPLQRPSSTGDLTSAIGKLSSPCPICVLGMTTENTPTWENLQSFLGRSMQPRRYRQR